MKQAGLPTVTEGMLRVKETGGVTDRELINGTYTVVPQEGSRLESKTGMMTLEAVTAVVFTVTLDAPTAIST